jgi:hypothetical protein
MGNGGTGAVVVFLCLLLTGAVASSTPPQQNPPQLTADPQVSTPAPTQNITPKPTLNIIHPIQTGDVNMSWLHTDGNKIRNESNVTVNLRGVALGGLGESGLTYWNGGHSQLVTQINGLHTLLPSCNIIRCGTGCSADGTGFDAPEVYATAIDDLIALVKPLGIRVVIEFHGGLNAATFQGMVADPSQLTAWFQYFATRYLTEKTVCGFELYNEPWSNYTTQANWAAAMTTVADAIWAINPDVLVLVASIPYGSVSSYWLTAPIVGNTVYTWDVYYCNMDNYWKADYYNGDYAAGKAKTTNFFDNYIATPAVCAALPVFCSEIGWFGDAAPAYPDDRNEAGWRYHMADLLDVANTRGTHYYIFWWWGNPDQQGLVSSFTYTTLSPQGTILNSYLNSTPPTNQTYTLVISSGGNGYCNPTGTQTLDVGQGCLVYAYPSVGYQLSHWVYDGVTTPATEPYNVSSGVASSSHTLQAVFSALPTPDTWTLTASVNGGGGAVSSATQTAILATNLIVTATPSVGSLFDYWLLNGAATAATNPKTVTSGGSTTTQTLVAYFKLAEWTLNASVSGAGGTVSDASQTDVLSIDLIVTAIPSANYVFDHWTLNGAATAATNPKTVTSGSSPATQALVAYFVASTPDPAEWELTILDGLGGTTDLTGVQTEAVDTAITVVATADAGYTFSHWVLDGTSVMSTSTILLLVVSQT